MRRASLYFGLFIVCGSLVALTFFIFSENPNVVALFRRSVWGENVRHLQEFLGWDVLTQPLLPSSAPPASQEMQSEVVAPAPLRVVRPASVPALTPAPAVVLTPFGIFIGTNLERIQNNLPVLQKNILLDAAASKKMQDMFLRQFFAHQSPDGRGAGDLAKDAGYNFVNIGENLALGDFESDAELVQAWMDSLGHRENILGTRYTEIGIAVGKGIFEGRDTWLAVQIFARPLSACPVPDELLQESIEEKKQRIEDLSALAEIKKAELDAISKNERERYNAKVEEYNAIVIELNVLVEEVKTLIEKYNGQVSIFNACVAAPAS